MNRLQQISSPAVPAVDDSVEAQFVHVPGGGALVPHEVEGTSHVGVAVVTKQIVLGEKVQRALFITAHKMMGAWSFSRKLIQKLSSYILRMFLMSLIHMKLALASLRRVRKNDLISQMLTTQCA